MSEGGYAVVKAQQQSTEDGPNDRDIVHLSNLNDGIYQIASFVGRSRRFFQTLEQIANLTSDKEIMALVTKERIFMFKMMSGMGKFTGTFAAFEKNLYSSLQEYWETSNQKITMENQKKNAENVVDNLDFLMGSHTQMKEFIKECEGLVEKSVEGKTQSVQDHVMEELGKFAGSEVLKLFLKEISDAMRKVTEAQNKIRDIAGKMPESQAQISDLSARIVISEQIMNNEKSKLTKLTAAADEIETLAKKRAREAGDNLNLATKVTVGGVPLYDYKDNKGEALQLRTDNLKKYASEASKDQRTQEEKAKEATAKYAKFKAELEKATSERLQLLKDLTAAQNELKEAQEEVKRLKEKEKVKAKEMNGNLFCIAECREQLQALPEMLALTQGSNNSMFSALTGHLDTFVLLRNRMKTFLKIENGEEAMEALKALRPVLKNAVDQSTFYQNNMAEFKLKLTDQKTQENMGKIENIEPTPAGEDATITNSKRTEAGEKLVSMEDDEELW